MRMVVMADTHVPKRAWDLPAPLWNAVDDADVVVHAGDWVDVPLLDALEQRAKRLIAVYGNNDGPALRARLPETARAELAGLRIAVIHETGPAIGRERRCATLFPDSDVLFFGQHNISRPVTRKGPGRVMATGTMTPSRHQHPDPGATGIRRKPAADSRLARPLR
ncbi:YfcE family phosphodiesterase [Catellatospora citrea]|uniref:YfcE family phosphodiesterase n=1 Tax=Catellatospora citrea TaxID=53366 RepID=UPI0033C85B05